MLTWTLGVVVLYYHEDALNSAGAHEPVEVEVYATVEAGALASDC